MLIVSRSSDVALWAKDDSQKDAKHDDKKDSKDAKKSEDKKPATRKSNDDSHAWVTVKTFSGTTSSKEKDLKFCITTKPWRVSFSTTKTGSVDSTHIRGALMVETIRDQNDQPKNWKQLDVLFDGEAGVEGKNQFEDGVDDSGQPKWFEIVITGMGTKYNVTVEDQGEKRGKGK
jgi:hypothetical protein